MKAQTNTVADRRGKKYGENLVLHLFPSFLLSALRLVCVATMFPVECFTAVVDVIMMKVYGDSVGD